MTKQQQWSFGDGRAPPPADITSAVVLFLWSRHDASSGRARDLAELDLVRADFWLERGATVSDLGDAPWIACLTTALHDHPAPHKAEPLPSPRHGWRRGRPRRDRIREWPTTVWFRRCALYLCLARELSMDGPPGTAWHQAAGEHRRLLGEALRTRRFLGVDGLRAAAAAGRASASTSISCAWSCGVLRQVRATQPRLSDPDLGVDTVWLDAMIRRLSRHMWLSLAHRTIAKPMPCEGA